MKQVKKLYIGDATVEVGIARRKPYIELYEEVINNKTGERLVTAQFIISDIPTQDILALIKALKGTIVRPLKSSKLKTK